MEKYIFKTKPFEHQLKALQISHDAECFALFMEQGTGKTKVIIDNAALLWERGVIHCLIVVAPNGVHRNWISDEIPMHMPDRVEWKGLIWKSSKSKTVGFKKEYKEFFNFKGLKILTINVDAVITNNGLAIISELLKNYSCMLIVDESTDIKTPGAKRTKVLKRLSKLAKYRRILTGTPSAESPLDLYSQMTFLNPLIFGFNSSFYAFKHEYAIWEKVILYGRKPFEKLVDYKNLDRLKAIIAPYSFRVTKDEALDLPPKLYTKRYFDLEKKQRKVYDEIREFLISEVQTNGLVSVDNVLSKILRLQQICSGYVPIEIFDEDGSVTPQMQYFDNPNPRLRLLDDIIGDNFDKTIIWCRFQYDIDTIMKYMNEKKRYAVRYDGQTSQEERERSIKEFQLGEAQYFVGNPAAGGRGITLNKAKIVIFYSNYIRLETRLQAEDRAHRIGLEHPVLYIDLLAENTVDDKLIIPALRGKKSLSDLIIDGKIGEWI